VASLLPLAVQAGAPAFAGWPVFGKGPLLLGQIWQAVGVPSMIPPLLGFVRGFTAHQYGETPVAAASWENSGLELRSLSHLARKEGRWRSTLDDARVGRRWLEGGS
jgi:hypothetical protein